MTNCMLFLVSASIVSRELRFYGTKVIWHVRSVRPNRLTRVRQRLFFEGLDRLIRFVCGASWPGWYLCLLSLTAASSLSTRARRGKKAMHGNSVIEFAGGVLSLSATAVYEGNEDRALQTVHGGTIAPNADTLGNVGIRYSKGCTYSWDHHARQASCRFQGKR